MAIGLMRGVQPLLHARQGSSRRVSIPSPWLLLLCVGIGYLWGCHQTRVLPYPVEEGAFDAPPGGLAAHLQQQQQQQPRGAVDASPVQPPAIPGAPAGADGSPAAAATAAAAAAAASARLFTHELGQQLLGSLQQQQQRLLPALPPPLTPGRSGDAFYSAAPYQILSWYPRIILYPGFLSQTQVAHVIALAGPQLEPSELGVVNKPFHPGAGRTDGQQVRNSHGVFLDRGSDPSGFLAWLEERIASTTLIPPSHGEDFNVLRYRPGQHYNSHMDTFDPHFIATTDPRFGQRMATFLMYLSDVEEGGQTVFKAEGRFGATRDVGDLSSCQPGDFKVAPRAGDAILFWSLNPDLTVNPRALHGACPVVKGEKWVMTKWIHDKPLTPWDGEAPRQHPRRQGAAAGTGAAS